MRIGKSIPYAVEKTVAKLEATALADDIRRDLIMSYAPALSRDNADEWTRLLSGGCLWCNFRSPRIH